MQVDIPTLERKENQRPNQTYIRTLTHPTQHPFRSKDHVPLQNSILLHVSIDTGYQGSHFPPPVKNVRTHKDGPYGRKVIKRLRVKELPAGLLWELEEATGEVVPDCVAQDIGGGFLWCEITARARGDEDEFTLSPS